MYDLRADQQIALYEPPQKNTGFTSCGVYFIYYYLFQLSLFPITYSLFAVFVFVLRLL